MRIRMAEFCLSITWHFWPTNMPSFHRFSSLVATLRLTYDWIASLWKGVKFCDAAVGSDLSGQSHFSKRDIHPA